MIIRTSMIVVLAHLHNATETVTPSLTEKFFSLSLQTVLDLCDRLEEEVFTSKFRR